jgi:hypothetical protein
VIHSARRIEYCASHIKRTSLGGDDTDTPATTMVESFSEWIERGDRGSPDEVLFVVVFRP